MGQYILNRGDAYNIWSDVVDACFFESALTIDQLREHIRDEFGPQGLEQLPARLERAHKTGCSALAGGTVEELARFWARVHKQDAATFVPRFLTLEVRTEGE